LVAPATYDTCSLNLAVYFTVHGLSSREVRSRRSDAYRGVILPGTLARQNRFFESIPFANNAVAVTGTTKITWDCMTKKNMMWYGRNAMPDAVSDAPQR